MEVIADALDACLPGAASSSPEFDHEGEERHDHSLHPRRVCEAALVVTLAACGASPSDTNTRPVGLGTDAPADERTFDFTEPQPGDTARNF